ncbi:yippee-like protein [Tilletiaria anomala UBC 951]|uniref:Protein yippee-like n=1 Tax=Tilletiaria anomala (strain ATCC 24038 / CBS 436.72 / UBC 951) TaxID=1037660 RepID=A0A066W9R4_TILAU|nr:yippee-like protein [Tilletiaria anomala UBC 951]KDN47520.1 yippee-like protein [Tilletiaria anomala UBC 951]
MVLSQRVSLFDTLPRSEASYSCSSCGTYLALADELISKSFSGREGKAYLFHSVLNCQQGKNEERQLLTGLHVVADLKCKGCAHGVGWTYVRAYEPAQKYKENKFILEKCSLHKNNGWL